MENLQCGTSEGTKCNIRQRLQKVNQIINKVGYSKHDNVKNMESSTKVDENQKRF